VVVVGLWGSSGGDCGVVGAVVMWGLSDCAGSPLKG